MRRMSASQPMTKKPGVLYSIKVMLRFPSRRHHETLSLHPLQRRVGGFDIDPFIPEIPGVHVGIIHAHNLMQPLASNLSLKGESLPATEGLRDQATFILIVDP